MSADYSYQDKLCRKIFTSLKKHLKTVLAASCAAGKTRMAVRVLKRYKAQKKRVLVLAHGQVVLRSQFAESAAELGLEVTELTGAEQTRGKLPAGSVIIAIPQAFSRMSYDLYDAYFSQFDLIVIDEAHHFYLSNLTVKILKAANAPHLLLTASPSRFIKANKRAGEGKEEYNIIFFSTEELLEHKVVRSPTIALGVSHYHISHNDFNENLNISDMKTNTHQTNKTIEEVRKAVVENCNLKDLSWPDLSRKRGKTLVVANNISHANGLLAALEKKKVRVRISTSEDDSDSREVALFKEKESFEVLVVVGRARLGFNFPELTTIVDISGTLNPDCMFQMLNRVTRLYKTKKLYLKIMPENLMEATTKNLNFTIALISPEIFKAYTGNFTRLRPESSDTKKIPYAEGVEAVKKERKVGEGGNRNYGLIPTFEIMREVQDSTFGKSFVSSIAEALEIKKRNQNRYPTLDDAYLACRKLEITTAREYAKHRQGDPMLPAQPRAVYKDWSYQELKGPR